MPRRPLRLRGAEAARSLDAVAARLGAAAGSRHLPSHPPSDDAQAGREALIASALSEGEKEQLHSLLRRLMGAFPEEVRDAAKRSKAKAHSADD